MRKSWLDKYVDKQYVESNYADMLDWYHAWEPDSFARFKKPKIAVGIMLSLLAVGAFSYLSIGYWWVQNTQQTKPATQTAQAVGQYENIDTETAVRWVNSVTAESERLLADTETDMNEEAYAMVGEAGESTMLAEAPVERFDPFAPLISTFGGDGAVLLDPTKEKDVLDDVQFTGFIDDDDSSEKVAILKVADPAGGEIAMVKKIGDSFYVDDKKIVIKDIRNNQLHLVVGGVKRTLLMNAYVDTVLSQAGGSVSGNSPASTLAGSPLGNNGSLELAE